MSFRSRLTYTGQAGRILACAACEGGGSVASGSADGSVHVWRMEYTTRAGGAPDRYTGIVGVRLQGMPARSCHCWPMGPKHQPLAGWLQDWVGSQSGGCRGSGRLYVLTTQALRSRRPPRRTSACCGTSPGYCKYPENARVLHRPAPGCAWDGRIMHAGPQQGIVKS